jgi:hypothetical protein
VIVPLLEAAPVLDVAVMVMFPILEPPLAGVTINHDVVSLDAVHGAFDVIALVMLVATDVGFHVDVSIVIVAVFGVDIVASITVAVPDSAVSAVDVALTVNVVAVSFAATLSSPSELMFVPLLPPMTDHVTAWGGFPVPFITAVNCCVAPLCTDGFAGLTVTLVTDGCWLICENRASNA